MSALLAPLEDSLPVPWVLTELKPMHKQVCSLLAQGFKNIDVARMSSITPEYVCMLLRQPLIKEEIVRIGEIAGARLELLFEKSVDVIAESMQHGTHSDKLKGARLQLEATKRIGRTETTVVVGDGGERLERLAEKLIGLQSIMQMRARDEATETMQVKEITLVGRVCELEGSAITVEQADESGGKEGQLAEGAG